MTEIYQLGVKALVRDQAGKILLLQVNNSSFDDKSHGEYWDLPGGRVEAGDTIEQTLQREVQEELGAQLEGEIKEFAYSVANIRIPWGDHKSGLILAVFECHIADPGSIILSDEHVAYEWFEPSTATQKLAVKYSGDFVAKLRTV
jgi:8-oxo-dGTP pyrophosphatase MutT (NUDIX family)